MERRRSPQDLTRMLGAADYESRARAGREIRDLGVHAVDALLQGSADADWLTRAESVALMGHLADDRCGDALRRALGDPSMHVRRHAVHAIGCQPCKRCPLALDVVGLLAERALMDASVRVRRAATHLLGLQPHDARAVEALRRIHLTERDPKLLRIARWGAQRLASQ